MQNEEKIIAVLEKLTDTVAGIQAEQQRTNEHLVRLEGRFDGLEERFDKLEAKVDKLEERFDKLEAKVDKLEERFDKLEAKVDKLEERFDKLEAKVDKLDERVGKLETTVEAIKRDTEAIAEQTAHLTEFKLEITRKVDSLMKVTKENTFDVTLLKANQA